MSVDAGVKGRLQFLARVGWLWMGPRVKAVQLPMVVMNVLQLSSFNYPSESWLVAR